MPAGMGYVGYLFVDIPGGYVRTIDVSQDPGYSRMTPVMLPFLQPPRPWTNWASSAVPAQVRPVQPGSFPWNSKPKHSMYGIFSYIFQAININQMQVSGENSYV